MKIQAYLIFENQRSNLAYNSISMIHTTGCNYKQTFNNYIQEKQQQIEIWWKYHKILVACRSRFTTVNNIMNGNLKLVKFPLNDEGYTNEIITLMSRKNS